MRTGHQGGVCLIIFQPYLHYFESKLQAKQMQSIAAKVSFCYQEVKYFHDVSPNVFTVAAISV